VYEKVLIATMRGLERERIFFERKNFLVLVAPMQIVLTDLYIKMQTEQSLVGYNRTPVVFAKYLFVVPINEKRIICFGAISNFTINF